MTDNELRAHDIAVKLLNPNPPQTITLTEEEIASGKVERRIDIFQEYLKLYYAALQALNKEFPE